MANTIETERLVLRRLKHSDAATFFEIVGNPLVMKHWAPGPDETEQDTAKRILDINTHWDEHGFGDWAVVEKANNQLVGFSGLHFITNVKEVNIGYAFHPNCWREGFGFETCQAVLQFGFATLELDTIVAVIAPENLASIRLAQKCGMQFWKQTTWAGNERVIHKKTRST